MNSDRFVELFFAVPWRRRHARGHALVRGGTRSAGADGYVYDPAQGDPERRIAPGTPFESLPESWRCPECRAPQAGFVPVDE